MTALTYSEQECIAFDPFFGEEADITCRTVKLVYVRKPHACHFGLNGDGHRLAIGDRARRERALVDGDYWGSYYICIPCLHREMAELRGDTPTAQRAGNQNGGKE